MSLPFSTDPSSFLPQVDSFISNVNEGSPMMDTPPRSGFFASDGSGDVEMTDSSDLTATTTSLDDEEDDELETIMGVTHSFGSNRLGVAYFIRSAGEFGWGETSETTDYRSIQYVKLRLRPSLILVTSKSSDAFIEAVKQPISTDAEDADNDVEMVDAVEEEQEGEGDAVGRSSSRRGKKSEGRFRLKFVRFRDFSFEEGKRKLATLWAVLNEKKNSPPVIRDEDGDTDMTSATPLSAPAFFSASFHQPPAPPSHVPPNDDDDLNGLSTVPLSENREMVRAACAVLSFIMTNKLLFGGTTDRDALRCISSVECMSFEGFLMMDVPTIKALRIFRVGTDEAGGMMGSTARKRSGRGTDCRSLFDLLASYVSSRVGRSLLRRWCSSPVLNIDDLSARHDAVQYFVGREDRLGSSGATMSILKSVRDELRHISDLRRIMRRFSVGKLSVRDWSSLYTTLFCFKQLFDALFQQSDSEIAMELAGRIPLFQKLIQTYNDDVIGVLQLLSDVFDFAASKEKKRMVILGGVSTDLDEKKNLYAGLDSLLSMVAEQELKQLPPDFPYPLRVAYFPQLGYLIALPKDPQLGENPVLQIQGYQFFFMSEECVYYKNSTMVEMDEHLGDVHEQVIDLESEMENTLAQEIVEGRSKALAAVTSVCAELDCIVAFAVCAREHHYVRPELTNEPGVLMIENGRNPLQEHYVAQFIPNDTMIPGNGRGLLNVVTGPNMSGKTVYLRQVGHIVFLAHIGCFVPATRARISLTDQILTRMHSAGSVAADRHSTFATDIVQMNGMLRSATRNSLLLIDEFGQGTLALDGIALLAASLRSFLGRQENLPRIFVSTHYTEIVEDKLIDVVGDPRVQFWTMSVMVQTSGEVREDQIVRADEVVFLYKLIQGRVVPSYGAVVAGLANIPDCLLFRARQVADMFRVGMPVEPLETEISVAKKKLYVGLVQRLSRTNCENEREVSELLRSLEQDQDGDVQMTGGEN